MHLEFPYQLVAFLDKTPAFGEPVYYGKNGWYPQIALKRRFKVYDMDEKSLINLISEYCAAAEPFSIATKDLIQPERMPVKIIEVEPSPVLMDFHNGFISYLGDRMVSRYPEREGGNYLPHITAEYNKEMVVYDSAYHNARFVVNRVYLLKDIENENSQAFASFELKKP